MWPTPWMGSRWRACQVRPAVDRSGSDYSPILSLTLPSLHTATQAQLQRVVVEYLTLPGWCTSTAGVTKFADLPQKAQDYVMQLQSLVGVPSEHCSCYADAPWLD